MFDCLSHLEFCAAKGAPIIASVINELMSIVDPARTVFATKLISSYSFLADPKKLSRHTLDGLDRMSLSRLKHLLLVLEVVVARGNGPRAHTIPPLEEHAAILQESLLPLLFLFVSVAPSHSLLLLTRPSPLAGC